MRCQHCQKEISGWIDIETAPRDGTTVMLKGNAMLEQKGKFLITWRDSKGRKCIPSHWMPIDA